MSKQYKIPILGSGTVEKLAGFTTNNAIKAFTPSQLPELQQLTNNDKILVQQDGSLDISSTSLATLADALSIPGIENTYNYSLFRGTHYPGATPISALSGWTVRKLDSAASYNAFGTLNSNNQIILPAGMYYCRALCPSASQVTSQKAILYDCTNDTILINGQSLVQATVCADYAFPAYLSGIFTLADEAILELRWYCGNNATLGYLNNIFSQLAWQEITESVIEFWKLDNTDALPYIMFYDQKASGTHGGSATATTWHIRDLNSSMGNCVNITRDGNSLTFQPGMYICYIRCPSFSTASTAGINVYIGTADSVVLLGMQSTGSKYSLCTIINGILTIETEVTYNIYHYAKAKRDNDGLGIACDIANIPEIYTTAEFWQLSE